MSLFGFVLVRKEEYAALRKGYNVWMRVIECRAWFSGWKDLNVIWHYLTTDTAYGGIGGARDNYAKERGTDVYGVQKPVHTGFEKGWVQKAVQGGNGDVLGPLPYQKPKTLLLSQKERKGPRKKKKETP